MGPGIRGIVNEELPQDQLGAPVVPGGEELLRFREGIGIGRDDGRDQKRDGGARHAAILWPPGCRGTTS